MAVCLLTSSSPGEGEDGLACSHTLTHKLCLRSRLSVMCSCGTKAGRKWELACHEGSALYLPTQKAPFVYPSFQLYCPVSSTKMVKNVFPQHTAEACLLADKESITGASSLFYPVAPARHSLAAFSLCGCTEDWRENSTSRSSACETWPSTRFSKVN